MKRNFWLLTLTVSLTLILSGCFQGEQSLDQEEIDPPQDDAEAVNDLEDDASQAEGDGETTDETETEELEGEGEPSETVTRELYLFDANGMVASQTLELPQPESKEVASQVLRYLVKDGPVTSLLPNGFQAVLPGGTQVLGLNLEENGTMIVDVSEDFENYQAENETKILQAMTYTLTQFENVDNIKLRIDGEPQESMPVNGTPVSEGYSRADGINVIHSDSADLMASEPVTLYYPSIHNENDYFVPVTQYIDVDDQGLYGSVVQALVNGPGYDTNLRHVFNSYTDLINNPSLREGVIEVEFSQDVLQDSEESVISDKVMETLVRTLTQDEAVEAVEVKVEDVETLFNENGEPYTEPVTTQSFLSTEKL